MKKSLFVLIFMFLFALPGFASSPVCLFTDVVSGPATGGEGGNGIYLSIFGKNFGANQGKSTVTVNGQAVAQYLAWGHDNDVTGDLDQVSVQIGNATTGTGNIVVSTPAGSCSNLSFTVRSGNIWYIGPGIDNDSPGKNCAAIKSGAAGNGAGGNGTFANPWTLTNMPNTDSYSAGSQNAYSPTTKRTPQTYYSCMAEGDTLVFLNGTSFLYGDGTGMHGALVLGSNQGSANSFMTFMARPGATVQLGSQGGTAFGIRDYTDTYAVISGLTLTGSGVDGEAIEFTTASAPNHMRLVGNTAKCPDCSGSAAAVSGGWELDQPTGLEILGNAVTDVACEVPGGVSNKQYHSIYLFGNDMEVGWNKVFNGCAYNGIQINYFTEESIGFGNLSIHDNDISEANGAGINLASVDPTQGYINIFNNVIHHVGLKSASDGSSFHTCIAFPGEAPSAGPGTANVYNNTLYDCSSYLNKVPDGNSCSVYMGSVTGQTGLKVNLINNILDQPAYTNTGSQNVYLCGGSAGAMLEGSNNLWFSGANPASVVLAKTVGSIADPLFVSAAAANLNLQSTSPAIQAGSASLDSMLDFNGATRPGVPAIGAFEYGTPVAANPISLSATPNPATAEETVTLTATVAQTGSAAPTGSISFMNGNESLGQAPLNGQGTATLVLSGLSGGSYSVVADYTGDSNYPQGDSAAVSLQVLATTTTALAASSNSIQAGQPLTLTASVQGSGGATPAGSVNFLNGTTLLGTATLNASGAGTVSIASLAAGQYSVTAQYAGNANFSASTSSSVAVTIIAVAGKQPTSTALAASSNSIAAGQSLTLTATVKGTNNGVPAGTVNFLNGATLLGTATLNASGAGTFSIATLAAGQHSLTAQYGGSANFVTSTSSAVSVTVTGAAIKRSTSTAMVASPNQVTAGQTMGLTATVKWSGAGVPTGKVGFLNGSTVVGSGALSSNGVASASISSLPAGTYSLTAHYTGDANFPASVSPAITVTVNKKAQLKADSTSLVVSPATVTVGQMLTLTATVKGIGGTTPIGSVTFQNGDKLLGKGTLNSAGVAKLSTASLAAGIHHLIAEYTGNANFAVSASPSVSVTVKPRTNTATLSLTASHATLNAGQALTLTATLKWKGATLPTGRVEILNGNKLLTDGILNASGETRLSIRNLPAETYHLTAQYKGDGHFSSSTSPAVSVIVKPKAGAASAKASLTASPRTIIAGKTMTLTTSMKWSGATRPTGKVEFLSGTRLLGSASLNSEGVAKLTIDSLAAGNYRLTAEYKGDANFAIDRSSPVSVTVKRKVRPA